MKVIRQIQISDEALLLLPVCLIFRASRLLRQKMVNREGHESASRK